MLDHHAARKGSSARAPARRGRSGAIAMAAFAGIETEGVQRNTASAANAMPADAKRRAERIPCRTGQVCFWAAASSSTSGRAVSTLLQTPRSAAGPITQPGAKTTSVCR